MSDETRLCSIFEAVIEAFAGELTRREFLDWLAEPQQLAFVAVISARRPDLVARLRRVCAETRDRLPLG
jgi:RecA-family ATPase